MVYHMTPENPIRKRKKWLSDSEQLKMIDILKHRANPLVLSTAQALNKLNAFRNTLLRGVERCWDLLRKIWNWSNWSNNRANTFPLFRGHPCVARQSRVHLHSNAQRVEPTHAQCPAYPSLSAMIQHEPLWNLRIAQHVESLLRSFDTALNNTSTNTQYVESLYSGQFQCICTQP